MSKSKVEYVLTVPAVWSDKARQMTMEAAMRAGLGLGSGTVAEEGEEGMGLLKLITEPEGAAEYALRSIQPNSMKVGYSFIYFPRDFSQSGLGLDHGWYEFETWNTVLWLDGFCSNMWWADE